MIPIRDSVPSRHPAVMTWTLIAVNAGIFFIELSLPEPTLERLFYTFGLVPGDYQALGTAPPGLTAWASFFTSMFLHGGWLHLIGNMWMLWIFGDNVEDRMGPLRFIGFYIVCGLIAAGVHVVTNPASEMPTVGASGALAGVLGAYFLMFPASRVIVLLPILFIPLFFELPAVIYLGLWFLIQFLSGTISVATGSEAGAGGIAWWAHIGGFLAGVVLYRLFLIRSRGNRAAGRS